MDQTADEFLNVQDYTLLVDYMDLTPRARSIFAAIVKAEGAPVSPTTMIEAGLVPNANNLSAHVRRIRKAFLKTVGVYPVLSTPNKWGFNKDERSGGYALNLTNAPSRSSTDMRPQEAPILTLDDFALLQAHLTLRPTGHVILDMIAARQGQPVAKQEFIDAGLVPNINTLVVQISKVRKAFQDTVRLDPFRSASSGHGYKKADRFDGYALNVAMPG